MADKEKRTGDDDTDSILEEMEEAGESLPEFGKTKSEKAEETDADAEDSDSDEEEDDDAEADDDADEEADTEKSEDATDEEESDDDAEDSDEEDAGEGDDKDEEQDSDAHLPVWKRYKNTKKALKEANDLIATLQTTKTSEDFSKKLADFAKAHKVNPEVAKGLVELAAELAAGKVGIDPKTKERLNSVLKKEDQSKFWEGQDKQYSRDFDSNVAAIATRDGLDVNGIKDLKKKIHAIAFKPGNEKKSLVTLYLELSKKPVTKKTNEAGKPTGRRMKAGDPEDMDDILEMSDEDFDKASDALGKNSKMRVSRS